MEKSLLGVFKNTADLNLLYINDLCVCLTELAKHVTITGRTCLPACRPMKALIDSNIICSIK